MITTSPFLSLRRCHPQTQEGRRRDHSRWYASQMVRRTGTVDLHGDPRRSEPDRPSQVVDVTSRPGLTPPKPCRPLSLAFVASVVVWSALSAAGQPAQSGQPGTKNGDWPTYGGDLASTRYSPLEQINAGNFGSLEV